MNVDALVKFLREYYGADKNVVSQIYTKNNIERDQRKVVDDTDYDLIIKISREKNNAI